MGKLQNFSASHREVKTEQPEENPAPHVEQKTEADDAQAFMDALTGGDEWTKPLS